MRTLVLTIAVLACGMLVSAQTPAKHRVLFDRIKVPVTTIYVADADGSNERALVPSKGLEYSPSYSVDGRWVVYTADREGQADIWRIHPDGTGVEQLTNDPAFDDQGALSPDGKTLTFVSTRGNGFANIWLMDLASKATRSLTRQQSGNFRPSWSPDGKWIAFSSDRDAHPGVNPGMWEHLQSLGIYIVRPDGKDLRRITPKGGVAGSPAWSADGKRILFYETDEVGAYLAETAQSRTEIVSIDVDNGERKYYTASNQTKLSPQWLPGGRIGFTLRSPGDDEGLKIWNPNRRVDTLVKGAVRNPSWTADGKHVAYQKISRIGPAEDFAPTDSRDPRFELGLIHSFPAFSADGGRIAYNEQVLIKAVGTNVDDADRGEARIAVMNTNGSGKRVLFARPGASAFYPAWAPVGDEIAFSVGAYFRTPGLPSAQIALIKSDGSDLRVIVNDDQNNGFPSWSPDGKRIVFRHGRQLAIVSLADRQITPLTDSGHYDNVPQWSPKGDSIAFTSDRAGDFEIYTIRPDGSGLRRLTNGGMNAHAVWSPDGEWIVFSSGRKGFKDERPLYDAAPQPYGEIFVMRADGSDQRQLTDNKWEDGLPAWVPEPARQISGLGR